MALTITANNANNDSVGIDVAAYLADFDATFSPAGFGFFSSSPTDFAGNQYAVSEQANLLPNTNLQSVVFDSGGGGNLIEYVFATHIVGGDLNALRFGYGLSYTAGNDSFQLAQTDLTISGFGYVNQYGAGNPVHTLLVDMMNGGTSVLNGLLASNAINFVGSTGADAFTGYAQNDTLKGGAGNDVLNGGGGTDTAIYTGARADYTVTNNGNGTWTVLDNRGGSPDGTDTLSNVELLQFTDQTLDLTAPVGPPMIKIDASNNSTGIDFEAFIRGGFISDATGGGFPVFDNSGAFSGEEMFVGYGSDPTSKYVLAHGALSYFFGTHTVWGEINTIEYGRLGSGYYDADGYYKGGNVELKITGLTGFSNAQAPEATVEATGPVHNFATAHMAGAFADQARLGLFADKLDEYAQHFVGSLFNDIYVGTSHDDLIFGNDGDDILVGGLGNDTIKGGNGLDTADYSTATGAVTVRLSTAQQQDTGSAGLDTLLGIERLVGSDYNDTLTGSARADSLYGGLGDDSLSGNQNDDLLAGGAGVDTLRGGDGNDTLIGGADRDVLQGGAGEDTFVFLAVSDSARGVDTRDTIRDFEGAGVAGGDVIDLSALNSDTVALTFYGDGKFHGGLGDVRTYQSAGGNTFVEVDIDGDKQADLQIVLTGLHNITVDDLILNGALIA